MMDPISKTVSSFRTVEADPKTYSRVTATGEKMVEQISEKLIAAIASVGDCPARIVATVFFEVGK